MTTPDTTTPEAAIDENATSAATPVVENEPAASEATAATNAETTVPTAGPVAEAPETPAAVVEPATAETPAAEAVGVATATAVTAPAATETAVTAPAPAVEEEDPQSTVFSLVTFFLAALPIIGVILNSIAVARAGKEGFDLWLARWGLALAIIETIGALLLVGLGYYFGLLSAGAI